MVANVVVPDLIILVAASSMRRSCVSRSKSLIILSFIAANWVLGR